jgi:DNA-binding MarR family transcriptional regulator
VIVRSLDDIVNTLYYMDMNKPVAGFGGSRIPTGARTPALIRALMRDTLRTSAGRLAARGFADLGPGQVGVLHIIGTGRRITEIASLLKTSKQAIKQTVDALVAHGYAERHSDHADGRAKVVTLTRRGRDAAAASLEIAEEIDKAWELILGFDSYNTMRAALITLISDARSGTTGWMSMQQPD